MHVIMFLVNNFRCGMLINVYWAITSYCLGSNYHIHPVLTLICPRTGVEVDIFERNDVQQTELNEIYIYNIIWGKMSGNGLSIDFDM